MEYTQQIMIPPKMEYWLYDIDAEIFASENLENDKFYVHVLRAFGFDKYRIVAKKIEHEYSAELDAIRYKQIALNENSEWFFQQLLVFISRKFDKPLNKATAPFYKITLKETFSEVKSLLEVTKLYSLMEEDKHNTLEGVIIEYENLLPSLENESFSYFKQLRNIVILFGFIESIKKLNKKLVQVRVENGKKLKIKDKINVLLILVIEDILYRKLFSKIENYRNEVMIYKKRLKEIPQQHLTIESPDNEKLALRVIAMRYIFEEIGIKYDNNKEKILKLLYFLFSDCKGEKISDFYIQMMYEFTSIPCADCEYINIRHEVIAKLKLINIIDCIDNSTRCCKISRVEYNSESELHFDISTINKKDKQRVYAIIFDYLFQELGKNREIEKNSKTEFVIWITGITNNSKRISDHTMYNYLKNPLGDYNQGAYKALKEAEEYIDGIGLKSTEKKIKEDLKKIKEENPHVITR